MEYKIIKSDPYSDNVEDFEKLVNSYLENGWELQGGIVLLPVDTNDKKSLSTQFIQTVFKRS